MEQKKHRKFLSLRIKLTVAYGLLGLIGPLAMGVTISVMNNRSTISSTTAMMSQIAQNQDAGYDTIVSTVNSHEQLLTNIIGYNANMSNYLPKILSDDSSERNTAQRAVTAALSGTSAIDGDSILGTVDYMKSSNPEIYDIRIYSEYLTKEYYQTTGSAFGGLIFPKDENDMMASIYDYFRSEDNRNQDYWIYVPATAEDATPHLYTMRPFGSYAATDTADIRYTGLVRMELTISRIVEPFTIAPDDYTGYYIYDNSNNLVSHSDMKTRDEKTENAILEQIPAILSDDTQQGTVYTDSHFITKQRLANGWTLVSYSSGQTIKDQIRNNKLLTFAITAGVIVLVTAVMLFPIIHLTNRINRLKAASDEVAKGNYDIHVQDVSQPLSDELAAVTDSFNDMAGKVRQTLQDMIETQDNISQSFAEILEAKSGESGHHVKRVSEYTALLAKAVGYNEQDVHDIRVASMLHDVGKIMIPNEVLEKPGRLTDEEFALIKQHVAYGEKMLTGIKGSIMEKASWIAGCHHERYDGKGYVKGLKGDEIPLYVCLVSIADVFDALVSRRSYKKPWTPEQARDEIIAQRGRQFSPKAVDAFVSVFPQFLEIAEMYKDPVREDDNTPDTFNHPENKAGMPIEPTAGKSEGSK